MRLDEEERAILAGDEGEVARIALAHQVKVGEFFAAQDFVRVTQAHIMADTESLGEAGVRWLEKLAQAAAVKGVEMTRQLGDQLRLDGHRAGIAKAGGDAIDGSFFAK